MTDCGNLYLQIKKWLLKVKETDIISSLMSPLTDIQGHHISKTFMINTKNNNIVRKHGSISIVVGPLHTYALTFFQRYVFLLPSMWHASWPPWQHGQLIKSKPADLFSSNWQYRHSWNALENVAGVIIPDYEKNKKGSHFAISLWNTEGCKKIII